MNGEESMETSIQGVALRCDQLKGMAEQERLLEFFELLEDAVRIPLVRPRLLALMSLLEVADKHLHYGRIVVLYELLEINMLSPRTRTEYTLKLAKHLKYTSNGNYLPQEVQWARDAALALALEVGGRAMRRRYEDALSVNTSSLREDNEFDDNPPRIRR
jgi:hypothetical protein